MTVAMILAFLLPASFAPAQEKPRWDLVRGRADKVGSFSYERIAEVYLSETDWKIVRGDEENSSPAPNRMVIGTVADNPVVQTVAQSVGIRYDGGSFHFQGERFGAGVGLAIVTADPDGEGTLLLITGSDPDGVFAGFSIPVDRDQLNSYVLARYQREIRRGTLGLSFDLKDIHVVRLDRDFHYLRSTLEPGASRGEVALRLAQGLGGYLPVYQAAVGPQVDLVSYMNLLLSRYAKSTEVTLEKFRQRDVKRDIVKLHRLCVEKLGPAQEAAPVYYTFVGSPDGTNARTFDRDPLTGRVRVLLNLAAFQDEQSFETAIVHETIHTLQSHDGKRLVDRAMREGVAMYLSAALLPGVADHKALMWSEEQFQAAEKYRKGILKAFRQAADSTDPNVHEQFLTLGGRIEKFPEAPSRSGYYVAWLAVKAWRAAHPKAPLGDVLSLPSDAAVISLDGK